MSQLRAACGGLLSSSASIHSGGSNAIGLSPYAARKRSRIPRRMRCVPLAFRTAARSLVRYEGLLARGLLRRTLPAGTGPFLGILVEGRRSRCPLSYRIGEPAWEDG